MIDLIRQYFEDEARERYPEDTGMPVAAKVQQTAFVHGAMYACEALDKAKTLVELSPEIAVAPSLRDQFAMAALQGLLASSLAYEAEAIVEMAWKFADAMMATRGKVMPPPEDRIAALLRRWIDLAKNSHPLTARAEALVADTQSALGL